MPVLYADVFLCGWDTHTLNANDHFSIIRWVIFTDNMLFPFMFYHFFLKNLDKATKTINAKCCNPFRVWMLYNYCYNRLLSSSLLPSSSSLLLCHPKDGVCKNSMCVYIIIAPHCSLAMECLEI